MTESIAGIGPAPLQGMWRVCQAVVALGGPALVPTVDAVRMSLTEPLRVAVAGRIKAGKSTLVNALVGRLVAPTAAGECTRVVTWYRYGSPDRAEIVRRDGYRVPLAFDGRLPEELGMPVEEIDHIEVHLQAGALRHLTLIDTPGLATTTTVNEAATRRALLGDSAASSRAVGQADAVLFLFREAERSDEVEFLRDLQASFGELGASAVNTIGLLSHADLFGAGPFSGEDPFVIAAERGRQLALDRAGELGEVIPVAALLAESARTGRLRESDARQLAALTGVNVTALRLADQLGPPPGIDAEALARLFKILGPYGVAEGRKRAVAGAGPVLEWMSTVSGIAAVEELIRSRFLRRAQVLKADHALAALEQAALGLPNERQVLAALEQARLDPDLQPLRELRALGLLARLDPNNPLREKLARVVDAQSDLQRLGLPDDPHTRHLGPAELAALAREQGAAAQATAGFAVTPAAAEAARVLARSFLLLARRQLARQQGLQAHPQSPQIPGQHYPPPGAAPYQGQQYPSQQSPPPQYPRQPYPPQQYPHPPAQPWHQGGS